MNRNTLWLKKCSHILLLAAMVMPSLIILDFARADDDAPREGHFTAPDLDSNVMLQSAESALTPGYYQTSEFMLGRVAVGVILPESDGSIDANASDWTAEQRQRTLDEVREGLGWWAALNPNAHLTFVIDDHASTPVATGYEPITRPQTDEGLWIGDVLGKLGYTGSTYWNRVRAYVNDLRATYQADWAFAVFVANSAGDADAAFSDGYFAYAYIGGPFLVMTYANAGYGIGNMDAVAAHETGHIFRALDQYPGAAPSCSARSGYLGVESQNGQRPGCASNESSIMRGGVYPYTIKAIDPYARGQIGWRDSDGDGIFDPLDTVPALSIESAGSIENAWTYSGRATDSAFPSSLRPSTTINDMWVEYRIDSSDWDLAVPTDGAFDSPDEAFTLSLTLTASGNHQVMLRARNSAGNVSGQTEFAAIVPDPEDGGLDTRLDPPSSEWPGGGAVKVLGGTATSYNVDGSPAAAIARVEYRIDSGEWRIAEPDDGAYDAAEEAFTIPSSLPGGAHQVDARAVDVNGKIEQHWASLEVTGSYSVFLPAVQR